MKKLIALTFLGLMAAGSAHAGENGGQADRYHEASSYPVEHCSR